MKNIFFIASLLFGGLLHAQVDCISFDYDDSGNRTSRFTDSDCNGEEGFVSANDSILDTKVNNLLTEANDKGAGQENKEALNISGDKNIIEGVQLYPNPATDIINIRGLENETLRTFQIVSSSDGRILRKWQSVNEKMVSVSHLVPGAYILEIGTASSQLRFSFIKK